ncbi:uncharacterized protein [Physcomitrium patens]|uniref:Uncharacterized protein n=1 Tax=Physcomitrium patens TaxID=3218 RepID=A0A2K1IF32_PHYPA|nr:uncharacterized protein LOC112276851 [Physcomitrium patens]XP_024364384.1 uncharacterized protein LOC112276851 [Physcomitrium patens]XP_024364385.1 uncharacterized protein LOC112276851 [Physcomitrium patens]XP_024364386.1 uncharacterized protein LOC112276851 [Physcomitrium patens]PNR27883.1 hypothetical protein PHYPA_028475 [Physcomitrium patens]|eukprot:XP_024364383.1 uncharacterized protein LOC112276851 [Physcomitrella patens]
MFRMEFRGEIIDSESEDDEPSTTYVKNENGGVKFESEKNRHKIADDEEDPPRCFEGRVGTLGQLQRVSISNEVEHSVSRQSPVNTSSSTLNSSGSVSKNWVEADLIDLGSPKAEAALQSAEPQPAQTSTVNLKVMRKTVKPLALSVNVTHQPSGKRIDNDAFVTFLEHQPRQDVGLRDLLTDGVDKVEAPSRLSRSGESPRLGVRSSSVQSSRSNSWSDSSDAEVNASHRNVKDSRERGSPAARAFKKLINKNKSGAPDAKFVKPWEEPLLAVHEQVKLQRKAAKLEAKRVAEESERVAEEAKKEAENAKRELLNLANPVPESTLRNQSEHHNRRIGLHRLFSGMHSNSPSPKESFVAVDARESKLVMPRASLFETCSSPSSTDVALAYIRSGTRPVARQDIHFATVESNQRDVEAWTMEQYMAKNARLEEWKSRDDDEEFGGIEGNQLMNRFDDHDVTNNYDSDSD